MRKSLSPNNFGKKYLVENCRKTKIVDFLRQYRVQLKEAVIKAQIEQSGRKVELTTSKTGFNGKRFWFKCPLCGRRSGVLYQHPINSAFGCRLCLRLNYRKRRFKGMFEEKILNTNK